MCAVVHFARIAETSDIERIRKQECDLLALQGTPAAFRPPARRASLYAVLKKKVRDVVIAELSFGIAFKRFANNRRFLFVHDDRACTHIIAIPKRRDARIYAATRFGTEATRHIHTQIAHILIRHTEFNGHEKHIVVRKIDAFMRRDFRYRPLLQKPGHTPAIYRIAGQAVYLPAQNPLRFSAFNASHHFFKNWTPWCFRTSLFNELLHNFQIIASCKRTQLGELRFNTQHLLILGICTFASVEEISHEYILSLQGFCYTPNMPLLDVLTVISYIALNIDIIFQIARILKTKSSRDISLVGLSIRYAAIIVILAKFISLSDVPLILGQGLIFLTISLYLVLVVSYRFRKAL